MGTDARGETLQSITAAGAMQVNALSDTAYTLSKNDLGKMITASYAGTTTITVPAPDASWIGFWCFIAQTVSQPLVLGGPIENNNQFMADNLDTSDLITMASEAGAMVRLMCISATKWLVADCSVGVAMTVEAED